MGTTVPSGLASAVEDAKKQIDKQYCYGLPHYDPKQKLQMRLVELGDLELFEDNDIDPEDQPDWLPLARLEDESQFLAVSTSPPHGVGMWEHETGEIMRVWASFDVFLSRIIGKKDKTPFELLDKTIEKVDALIEKKAYADALGLIEPMLAKLPQLVDDEHVASAYNSYGLALSNTGKHREATAAFQRAAAGGESLGELNLLSTLIDDLGEPEEAIAFAGSLQKVAEQGDWIRRYLARAYLMTGALDKAEAALRELVARHEITGTKLLDEARAELETYAASGKPNADAAKRFAGWVVGKSYTGTPEQRAWWNRLPVHMRDLLAKEVGTTRDEITDEGIARSQDVELLYLEGGEYNPEPQGCEIDDVSIFLPLRNVTRLSFYGAPETVEPLRALPRLEMLKLNNTVVKNFVVPSSADRALWKAAEAGDLAGVKAAIARGASIGARDDQGRTALALASLTHDLELCRYLVAQGADPWAGSYLGGTLLGAFDDEGRAQLEAAAKAAKIPDPELSPWRVLAWQRDFNHAFFDEDKLPKQLGKGVPLAATWGDVTLQMEKPKKDNKLYDIHAVKTTFAVSERLAEMLRGAKGLELLPVKIADHAGKARKEKYVLLNPLAVDCLELDRCAPRWSVWNPDDTEAIAAQVIDPARTGGAEVFRCVNDLEPIIITRELAAKLAIGSAVRIGHLKR